MADIAFGIRWLMILRFTDGHYTVMAFTAISKNFLMINKRDNVKSLGGMTGLAVITASNVIRCFRKKYFAVCLKEPAVMTIHAI